MEKKQRFKKCKNLMIDLNQKFQPETPPVATQQKWQPFGPFPCVLSPPLSPPSRSTSLVPAKNLVFRDLQPLRTAASDGTPAANDVNCPRRRGFSLDRRPLNYGDDSAFKTLPLLPTSSWKRCDSPSRHQLAPSTMTIFYSGGVSAFHDISPEKVELVLGMAGKSNTGDMNEVIGDRSEEIERKRWKENRRLCVYATDESCSTVAPSSSSGSSYQSFKAPGAIAMARKATLARFLEKRKHRLIHRKAYLPDLSL